MSNFRNRQSAEILGSVYKNAEMAYEASGEVLKHCANRKLAGEISVSYTHLTLPTTERV